MVGDRFGPSRGDSSPPPRRDRGQLILVGAIAIAFIVLGLVVVFNGVLYTETISSSSTSQSAADAAVVEAELEQGVVGIVQRGNLEGGADEDTIEDGFASQYRETKANGRPVLVDVEATTTENATTASGTDVGSDTYLFDATMDGRDVARLQFEFRVGDGGTLNVTDGDGTERLRVEDSGGQVRVFDSSGSECGSSGGSIEVDAVSGEISAGGTCAFDLNSADTLDLSHDGIDGTTEYVVRDDANGNGIWSLDLDVTYRSDQVTYDRTQSIDVYGDRA